MMIEESETPDVDSKADVAGDVLAERRARHADPAVIRRAEAAEAVARNLETHLAALEQRIEEVGRERERVAQQLSERETDVRSVKQREYAEQQLRVEAEERSERLQREMRAQIQELSKRLQETEHHVQELKVELTQLRERDARLTPIVRELMDVAAGLRAGFERELTTLREELQQQVVWERETYVRELTAMGARMEDLRFELTRTAADLRAQLSAEPLNAALLEAHNRPSVRARGSPSPGDGRRPGGRCRTSTRQGCRGQGGRGGRDAGAGGRRVARVIDAGRCGRADAESSQAI